MPKKNFWEENKDNSEEVVEPESIEDSSEEVIEEPIPDSNGTETPTVIIDGVGS